MAASSHSPFRTFNRRFQLPWVTYLTQNPPEKIEGIIEKKVASVAEKLKSFNLTSSHIKLIADFYIKEYEKTNLIRSEHFRRDDENHLPVSVVFIALENDGDYAFSGLYLLIKGVLPKKPVAFGANNVMTFAFHWELEKICLFRSGLKGNLGPYEVGLNRSLGMYSDYFVPATFVFYKGPCSVRRMDPRTRALKVTYPKDLTMKDKAGAIVDYMKHGSVNSFFSDDQNLEGFTYEKRLTFALKCARGVKIVHDRGYVHLDLQLNNILVDDDCNPKLIDFGLTHRVGELVLVSGTPGVTSPQRLAYDWTTKWITYIEGKETKKKWLGEPVAASFADDVWSLGSIFTMILGKDDRWYRWAVRNHSNQIVMSDSGAVSRVLHAFHSGDSFVNRLIRNCLAYEVEKRIGIDQIIADLEGELANLEKTR